MVKLTVVARRLLASLFWVVKNIIHTKTKSLLIISLEFEWYSRQSYENRFPLKICFSSLCFASNVVLWWMRTRGSILFQWFSSVVLVASRQFISSFKCTTLSFNCNNFTTLFVWYLCPTMDEEDAHFCLRCRATIQGLENYVHHRRQKCQPISYGTKTPDHGSTNHTTTNHTSYLSIGRSGASGSNSTSIRNYLHVPNKSSVSDPILSSSSNHMEERYKSRHGSENPLVADLSVETSTDDFMSHLGLCMVSSTTWAADIHSEEPLRADDFFSLLELQSCKGTESGRQRPRRSLEPVVPTSERLKPEVESIQTEDQQQDSTFPLVVTSDLNSSHDSAVVELASNEEMADNSGLLVNGDVTSAFSSPEVVTNSSSVLCTDVEVTCLTANDLDVSPPQSAKLSYPSRGKWMPGLKPRVIHKAGSSVEYHCKPCNRRLTGRVVFEKHLQSELHFKRTAQQLDATVGAKYGLRRKRDQSEQPSVSTEREMDVLEDDEDVDDPWRINKRKKKGEKNVRRCPTCSVWVPKPLFGKHLVSRYHISRCRKHPDRDRCILDHIHLIVLEAPFQCRLCRFYCHSHADLLGNCLLFAQFVLIFLWKSNKVFNRLLLFFCCSKKLAHWKSADHAECDLKDSTRRSGGTYFCSLCRIGQLDCETMRQHLESERHLNCVDIVNKSVAVVVSKLERIQCHLCSPSLASSTTFRYRMALNQHLASEHSMASGMLTQHSGRVFACDHCTFKTSSNWAFTHHRFNCEAAPSNEIRYRCLVCNLSFPTKEEVTRHRSTQEHRDTATRQHGSYGSTIRVRSCPHCYQTFADLSALKEHFLSDHPDLLPRCIRCGATFALKQQLSAHRFVEMRHTSIKNDGWLFFIISKKNRNNNVFLFYFVMIIWTGEKNKPVGAIAK